MTRGSLGVRTSSGSSGAAAWELIANPVQGTYLKELHVALAAATASTYGLGRPAAKGITPTTPVGILPELGNEVISTRSTVAVAWGTGPTVPAAFFRRFAFPATIGSNIQFVFSGRGIFVPAGSTIILWNLAANGVVDVNAVVDELWA